LYNSDDTGFVDWYIEEKTHHKNFTVNKNKLSELYHIEIGAPKFEFIENLSLIRK